MFSWVLDIGSGEASFTKEASHRPMQVACQGLDRKMAPLNRRKRPLCSRKARQCRKAAAGVTHLKYICALRSSAPVRVSGRSFTELARQEVNERPYPWRNQAPLRSHGINTRI